MKFFRASAFAVVWVISLVWAGAQEMPSVKIDLESDRHLVFTRMDDLLLNSLMDSGVLSDLHLTGPQLECIAAKTKIQQMMIVTLTSSIANGELDDDDQKQLTANLSSLLTDCKFGLSLADLNDGQKKSLRRSVLAHRPFEALLTEEVSFALKLTDAQRAQIAHARETFFTEKDRLQSSGDDASKAAELFPKKSDVEDLSDVEKVQEATRFMDLMMKTVLNRSLRNLDLVAKANRNAHEQALAVLTR